MRGIIYKDLCLFFKGLNKWILLLLGGLLVFFVAKGGVHAGMLFSFALDMMVGLLHLTALEEEEKAAWKPYQRTLPVNAGTVITGKYAAILLTVLVSIAGALLSNLAAFAVYRAFRPEVLGLSLLMAAVIPLLWTAFSLPFYYWLGSQIAQYISMPLALLLFFFVKNFEDGLWAVTDMMPLLGSHFVPLAGVLALAGLFLASLALSAAGYCRKGGRRFARNHL